MSTYTLEEVEKHKSVEQGVWLVLKDKKEESAVYNVQVSIRLLLPNLL